ncbi:MAG: chromosomal replication initiator protein DnaA [Candidatus Kapaibacteriota bacterium]|jgi:chromosomal replication initiator protein
MIHIDLFDNIEIQHKDNDVITNSNSTGRELLNNLESTNSSNYSTDNYAVNEWNNCLKFIADNVSPQVYKTWFSSLKAIKFENQELTLQVPGQFIFEWIEEHYYHLIQKTITKFFGEGTNLLYDVVVAKNNDDSLESRTVKISAFSKQPSIKVSETTEKFITNLNPKYSFDSFVVGDNNQLACSAAKAVAKAPGATKFNPLFIYGHTGLGKTHLVQSIGNTIISHNPNSKVFYTNGDKFYADYVNAIMNHSQVKFSTDLQKVDVLIIDDIQFLTGKEKTLEHFFHLFNELHQYGKQIIITSDKAPVELNGIDERLISRFKWGLTVDIQKPDLETKVAILKKKCLEDGLDIPSDILEYIAENITTSVRELEGALIRIIAGVTLDRKELNINLAKEVVLGYNKFEPKPATIEFVKETVSDYYKIPIELIESSTRKQEIALARQMSMYLTKKFTKLSLKAIGAGFGNRDHSTVLHSCTTIDNYLDTDKKVKADFENLVNYIKKNAIINN